MDPNSPRDRDAHRRSSQLQAEAARKVTDDAPKRGVLDNADNPALQHSSQARAQPAWEYWYGNRPRQYPCPRLLGLLPVFVYLCITGAILGYSASRQRHYVSQSYHDRNCQPAMYNQYFSDHNSSWYHFDFIYQGYGHGFCEHLPTPLMSSFRILVRPSDGYRVAFMATDAIIQVRQQPNVAPNQIAQPRSSQLQNQSDVTATLYYRGSIKVGFELLQRSHCELLSYPSNSTLPNCPAFHDSSNCTLIFLFNCSGTIILYDLRQDPVVKADLSQLAHTCTLNLAKFSFNCVTTGIDDYLNVLTAIVSICITAHGLMKCLYPVLIRRCCAIPGPVIADRSA